MLVLASGVVLSVSCGAATIRVPADYPTIQEGIDAAVDGDTVLVGPGEYLITEPIDFNRLHNPDDRESPAVKNITLKSQGGAEVSILRMSDTPADPDRASVVVFENGESEKSALEGFTLAGGSGTRGAQRWRAGGGVYCNGSSPRVNNCTIVENSGCGLYFRASSTALTNCTIQENSREGVRCVGKASPTLTNCTIVRNEIGVYASDDSSPTLTNCTIQENSLSGVVCTGNASPSIVDCRIEGNWGWIEGGGVHCIGPSRAILTNCTIAGNSSLQGAGIHCGPGSAPTIANCIISTNYAYHDEDGEHGEGGGIFCRESSPEIINTTIEGNSAQRGGGIFCDANSTPVIMDCNISCNLAYLGGEDDDEYGEGGGVFCRASSPIFERCVLSDNSAEGSGGGVFYASAFGTLTDCSITRNYAGECGGGIACRGDSTPTFANCTIARNASPHGSLSGEFWCTGRSAPFLTNCTISSNFNGAVECVDESSPAISHCTISGNGGVGVHSADTSCPILSSCIVWDNGRGSIVARGRAQPTVTYCCVEGDVVWPGEGNIRDDPLFCGWGEGAEVYVDASSPEAGDGSEENPYSELNSAFQYDYALSNRSPCVGTGADGTNMGADWGICSSAGHSRRVVHVAAGTYRVGWLTMAHKVSLHGAGAENTAIEACIVGLRTETVMADVTVIADTLGGILVGGGEAPVIARCAITTKPSDWWYPVVLCYDNCSPNLASCTISGTWLGGLGCFNDSSPVLENCILRWIHDDAVWCCHNSSLLLTNCAIVGNGGRGVWCRDESSATLMNCTISSNTGYGVSCSDDSRLTLTNCIVWDNRAESISIHPSGNGAQQVQATYSCIAGHEPWPGVGNVNVDPLFVEPVCYWDVSDDVRVAGDFRLQSHSHCIDRGTAQDAPGRDLAGNARPCWNGVDIGAYEYCGDTPPNPAPLFQRADSNTEGRLDIADAVFTLSYLFASGPSPRCLDAADSNDDGAVNIADAIALLRYLFGGGGDLSEPFGECGGDSTADELGCAEYPPCQ